MAECTMSETQAIIWNNFKELKKILDENNMKYYMLGGTLLGAVRHHGFIPWDDDIDIGIERSEYEKLINILEKGLPDHLRLDTFRNNTEYHYYFSRVVDTRYQMRREGSIESRNENVWIDIFPLDGMPNGWFLRKMHMMRLLFVRARYHISCFEKVNLMRPNRPLTERIIIRFVAVTGLGRHADTRQLLEKMDGLLKKYSVKDTDWIVNAMGQYKFKEMFHKKNYGSGKLYDFEDLQLMGPENADFVLTQMYGDYMTPPKEEDRGVHAASLIKKE